MAPRDGVRGDGVGRRKLDSPAIEDYYFTPWDLGYGSYVKFDHDFIGREALERMADAEHREKVTLALDDEDVTRTIGTMFQKSDRAKFMDWPAAVYSMHQYDKVMVDGETVGVSTWIAYSSNEGKMLTLAVLDAEYAEPGTEVTFVWGEEDGGTHQAHRRVPRPNRDRRRCVPGPVRRSGTDVVCAGRLASDLVVMARIVDNIGADLVESIITSTRVLIRHVVAVAAGRLADDQVTCHVEGEP